MWRRFPHSQEAIKESKKKFNAESREVISEELALHMKSLSLSWMKQSFTLDQQRQMHQVADELKFLNARDVGKLTASLQRKLDRPDYQPYLEHIDQYILANLK